MEKQFVTFLNQICFWVKNTEEGHSFTKFLHSVSQGDLIAGMHVNLC